MPSSFFGRRVFMEGAPVLLTELMIFGIISLSLCWPMLPYLQGHYQGGVAIAFSILTFSFVILWIIVLGLDRYFDWPLSLRD